MEASLPRKLLAGEALGDDSHSTGQTAQSCSKIKSRGSPQNSENKDMKRQEYFVGLS